ncbi:MAG: hypothetical protein HZB83_00250, partial [Deltaproteobacteria bacterium]|nr:hypothetical protein [Deltaproteobacteria bacterium]
GRRYLRFTELDSISHYASAGMKAELSEKTKLEAKEVFTYTKESLEAAETGIQTGRGGILSNTVSLMVEQATGQKTSFAVNLSDNVMRFDSPSAIDSRTSVAGIKGTYKMRETLSLNANYAFTAFLFDQSDSDFETHSLQAGFTHQPSPGINIDVSGGAVYTQKRETRDWIGEARLRKAAERSSFDIGYSRRSSNTSGLTDTGSINERYTLRWAYMLTELSDLALSGNYSTNKTRPVAVVDQSSYGAEIAWTWRAYKWLALSAGASHFQQRSDGAVGFDVSRYNVFVNIAATTYEQRF